MAYQEQ